MTDTRHIERILKVNGLSKESSENEIRSVLEAAGYQEPESYIVLLKNQDEEEDGKVKAVMEEDDDILLTDKELNSDQIAKLLGIDVKETFESLDDDRNRRRSVSVWQIFTIIVFSIITGVIITIMIIGKDGFSAMLW